MKYPWQSYNLVETPQGGKRNPRKEDRLEAVKGMLKG